MSSTILLSRGVQDKALSHTPQFTPFRTMYKRYTNFAMESTEQTFVSTAKFGSKPSCTISRNGDLLSKMYLEVTLPKLVTELIGKESTIWADYIGHRLIRNIEVNIGGVKMDSHPGDFLHMWYELSCKNKKGYDALIGRKVTKDGQKIIIPLQFWFNQNYGLSLPLIALTHHDVRIIVEFSDLKDCVTEDYQNKPSNTIVQDTTLETKLFCDFIFLEQDERTRFAKTPHEYLIHQVNHQRETYNTLKPKVALNFNHPVSELIWTITDKPDSTNVATGGKQTTTTNCGMCGSCTATSHAVANKELKEAIEYVRDTEFDGEGKNILELITKVFQTSGTPTAATAVGELYDLLYPSTGTAPVQESTLQKNSAWMEFKNLYDAVITEPVTTPSALKKSMSSTFLGLISDYEVEKELEPNKVLGSTPVYDFIEDDSVAKIGNVIQMYFEDLFTRIKTSDKNNALGVFTNGKGKQKPCLMPNVDSTYEDLLTSAVLTMNNNQAFQERDSYYFNQWVPYNHHTNMPRTGIYCYSFCTYPEDFVQPSGSCNFSRIDSVQLNLTLNDGTVTTTGKKQPSNASKAYYVTVYSRNFNVLRIMGGMAGLAFSS